MKILFIKIHNWKFYTLFFAFLAIVFSFLPWEKPSVVFSKNKGTVNFNLERSNGENFKRTIEFPDGPTYSIFANQRIISFEKSENHSISIKSDNISYLKSPKIIFAILITCLAITAFVYYVFSLLIRSDRIWPFVIHAGILSVLFAGIFPGLYNYDSFSMLSGIATLDTNEFHGLYFQSIFLTIFQLSPYAWTLSLANLICITTFLYHLYILSSELHVKKYYWMCCLIFYLYPPNILLTFMASRDPISYWIFFILTMEFFSTFAKSDFTKSNAIILGLSSGVVCLFRPETTFVLIPYLLLLPIVYYRQQWKWFACLITFPFATMIFKPILNLTSIGHDKASLIAYETTLIINPLSYIIKNRYGELTPELDKKLGPYFKNDYLVKYQTNHDIEAFHKGGVNFDNLDSYNQFRSQAIQIILENPILFVENRIKLAQTMFNFGGDKNYIGGGNEYNSNREFYEATKNQFSFKQFYHSSFLRKLINRFLKYIDSDPQFIFKSYLIPFLLILVSTILAPSGSTYFKILILYLMRTTLVLATAPAGYFKYNYALWLFGLFGTLCVIWERRLTLHQKMGQNNQGI